LVWCIYILLCKDGTLYTGMTNNLPRRLAQHEAGKGAKYTRGRAPLTLVYLSPCASKSAALKEECRVKGLSRAGKLALIAGCPLGV
jgi:putative endonuclease